MVFAPSVMFQTEVLGCWHETSPVNGRLERQARFAGQIYYYHSHKYLIQLSNI